MVRAATCAGDYRSWREVTQGYAQPLHELPVCFQLRVHDPRRFGRFAEETRVFVTAHVKSLSSATKS
jgi:hypothetical protein